MEERALKRLAANSIAFMMTIILISAIFTRTQNTIYADETTSLKTQQMTANGRFNLLNDELYDIIKISDIEMDTFHEELISKLGSNYIVIDKPIGNNVSLSMQDIYMKNAVRIEITGLVDKSIDYNSVVRVKGDIEYTGKPDVQEKLIENDEEKTIEDELLESKDQNNKIEKNNQDEDILEDMKLSYSYNSDSQEYVAALNLVLDKVYVHTIYQDKGHFYIKLENPRDVYENILVLDIGHGGNDVGSYTDDMTCFEKNLNLDIGLRIKRYLENNSDIKVYYTRLEDEKIYLNPRVNLANELGADLFLSIHCNSSDVKQAHGTEVLFGGKNKKISKKSKQYAQICLDELLNNINTRNRGIILRNDVYIIGKSKVPVILVESAYISNKEDFKFLIKEGNREKIAEGVYNGILRVFEEK